MPVKTWAGESEGLLFEGGQGTARRAVPKIREIHSWRFWINSVPNALKSVLKLLLGLEYFLWSRPDQIVAGGEKSEKFLISFRADSRQKAHRILCMPQEFLLRV